MITEKNKQYEVTVTEILERTIKVTAASKAEAEEKVSSMYNRQEVVLDWSDFVDVNYNTVELETEND